MYFVVCHNDEHSKIGHNYRKKKCSNITVAMIRVFQQRTYIFLRFRWLHIDKNLAANYQGLSLITYSKKIVFLKKANSLLATKLYIQPKNRRYCILQHISLENWPPFVNPTLLNFAPFFLKFMFSKKATKIDQIFTIDLTFTKQVSNRRWRFRQFLWPY